MADHRYIDTAGYQLNASDLVSGDYLVILDASDLDATTSQRTVKYMEATRLADLVNLTPTDSNFIVGNGSAFVLEDASTARASLGLVIGTDVQAYDAGLADIAGLAVTDGNVIVGDGANWVAESGATARTSLGLTIGTDVQAWDDDLDDLAALTPTKGNVIVGNGTDWVSLGVGTDTQVLTADSAEASGIKWAAGGGGGGTPGGTSGDIQYNNAGSFGGFGDWDGTTLDIGEGHLETNRASSSTHISITSGTNFLSLFTGSNASFPSTLIWPTGRGLRFGSATNVSGSSYAERGRWDSGGELMIGLTTALGGSTKLSVNGAISAYRATQSSASTVLLYTGAAKTFSFGLLASTDDFVVAENGDAAEVRMRVYSDNDLTKVIGRYTNDTSIKNILAINRVNPAAGGGAGFGAALAAELESSTTEDQAAGRLSWEWITATHASRASRGDLSSYYTSTERTSISWGSNSSAALLSFFDATLVIQQAGTGETTGFTANSGTTVNDASTFTGNVGSTAYRISDVVKALKNYGLLAA